MSKGFDGYISKPIEPDVLDNVILTTLPGKVFPKGTNEYDNNSIISDEEAEKIRILETNVIGINVMDAIEKYAGSYDFYIDMLSGVLAADRMTKLIAAYMKKDYKEYRMEAHTLKGLTRSVGMYMLADAFEKLQKACDEGDYAYVDMHHEKVVSDYYATIDQIYALEE